MKERTSRMLAIAASAILAAMAAVAVEVDGIAAKVGSETILRSEVAREMMRQGVRDASRFAEVRDEMVERKLIVKAAKEAKMTIPDWVVENRVREIVQKSFGGDRNRLIEMLGEQRVSYPEWYARLKEDVVVGAMRWNIVNKNITASPAEMRRMYDAHPEHYASNGCVSVSVVILKPEERVRRDEISAALKDKTFAELGGKTYADIRPEDVFQPEVCAAIAKLAKGEVSPWIDLDGWSFILRKDDERPGKQLTFAEAFNAVEDDVREEKSKKAFQAWMARLRAETFVRVYE